MYIFNLAAGVAINYQLLQNATDTLNRVFIVQILITTFHFSHSGKCHSKSRAEWFSVSTKQFWRQW